MKGLEGDYKGERCINRETSRNFLVSTITLPMRPSATSHLHEFETPQQLLAEPLGASTLENPTT
jgi:hypothetical protein